MSTVATFLEDVLHRIPEDQTQRIFPALNKALRIIAKRLYLFESDLVKEELSVPVYAEDAYTASTIAFVSNKPEAADTITDSASQFVTEGFQVDMAVETDYTTNPGPYRITAVAAGTLTLHADHSISAIAAGTSYTLTSRDDFGYLPSDFWGLFSDSKPYISGKTWPLLPLPTQDEKLNWSSAGEPYWYEIIGDRLYLTPPTDSDVTVKGFYFKKPTVSNFEDTMPYFELFDEILQEYLVEILTTGAGNGMSVQAQLMTGVDLVVAKRPRKGPNLMTQGINWNDL